MGCISLWFVFMLKWLGYLKLSVQVCQLKVEVSKFVEVISLLDQLNDVVIICFGWKNSLQFMGFFIKCFSFFSKSTILGILFICNFSLDFLLPTKYCELCCDYFFWLYSWLFSPRLSRFSIALLTGVVLLEKKKS